MTNEISIDNQDDSVEIKINGFPIIYITNRLNELMLEIEIFDTEGSQVISQSISPDKLKLYGKHFSKRN